MGVPGWLLNLVMGFLADRVMLVRYKGETTNCKPLPGGGPQGTLLGLLLFLVLINDCGFERKDESESVGERIRKKKKQAGAELGQAQPKLGLDFTLLYLT